MTDEQTNASENESEPKPAGKLRGGMDAREMGRRSAQRRAERKEAEREAETEGVEIAERTVVVRTTVHVSKIMKRLAVDAAKGNTQAARELREWMREFPVETETDMAALDRRTRQQLMARLLADIEADEGQLPASVDD